MTVTLMELTSDCRYKLWRDFLINHCRIVRRSDIGQVLVLRETLALVMHLFFPQREGRPFERSMELSHSV